MNPRRRALLCAGTAAAGGVGLCGAPLHTNAAGGETNAGSVVQRGRRLEFPRDHGAHPRARTEWWYATGWIAAEAARPHEPTHGFQITFFRSRVPAVPAAPQVTRAEAAEGAARSTGDPGRAASSSGVASNAGRFAPQHLLFAHAAITELSAGRHHHAQRIARWNGEPATGPDRARLDDAALTLARWHLRREGPLAQPQWQTHVRAEKWALHGSLHATQATLLQGDGGFSRKGPEERQASHYYSVPQLAVQLELELHGQRVRGPGRAWLDHEWSDELLHPLAVGWDWIGFNLLDGSALTAFRLRRADGSTLWAGGSFRAGTERAASEPARNFAPGEVAFTPGRHWRSAATNARYPVQWQLHTPAGLYSVRALLDAQEMDSRGSTGAVYWEGLSELLNAEGRRVGLGYLEMTGYAAPIKLG